MIPPLVSEMASAFAESFEALAEEISNVRLAPYVGGGFDSIIFDFRGVSCLGVLRGRNLDLCFGHGADFDKRIAARVLIDGDSDFPK